MSIWPKPTRAAGATNNRMEAKGHVGRSMEQDGGTDGHAPRNSCHAALTPCLTLRGLMAGSWR